MADNKANERKGDRKPGSGKARERTERKGKVGEELLDGMRQLLDSMKGSKDASAREQELLHDNFKLRRKNAELNDLNEELESLVPEEGSAIISAEDKKELDEFRALKLKPADITKQGEELVKLQGEAKQRENESVYADAAEALGYANVAAVSKALKREGLHIEMKTVKRDDPDNPGRKISVEEPHVRKANDEKAPLELLSDYIDRELSDFIPAFEAEPKSDEDEGEAEGAGNAKAGVGASAMRSVRPGNGTSGASAVAIPTTKRTAVPSGAGRQERATEDAIKAKRQRGGYGL